MHLIHIIQNNGRNKSLTSTDKSKLNTEIIQELKAGHQLLLNKLIPEIEQHFVALTVGTMNSSKRTVLECFSNFNDFRLKLTDHIAVEEEFVFPYFLGLGSPNAKEAVVNFIEKHESHEHVLSHLIEEIQLKLTNLQDWMVFRMLVLKLETLNTFFCAHGQVEDDLFEEFRF